ncbi:MAG: hypothetical protein FGM24_10035 [Candidatus Kapabacteria bacterium]|nr:hypothetical protein [Candidatus Kapabacteria bacterium]
MATIRIVLALLLAVAHVAAQDVLDSRGTEFWLAFMPNDHSGTNRDPSLIIYVTAEQPTSGVVDATRRTGQTDQYPFTVAVANEVVRVNLPYGAYELLGATVNSNNTGDCEAVMPCAVRITSDLPISVYAASREVTTTDAWLALPTDVLGTDYRVMSYASDAVDAAGRLSRAYPSQFVVIGTEDSTDVTIDLSVDRTQLQTASQRNIRLNRGQVYLVQAYVTQQRRNDDLTGSRIRSTRPIALISGHFRAQVPILAPGSSRDMLVEQIPPTETWGKNTMVVPPAEPSGVLYINASDRPQLRVMAARDGTNVLLNGVPTTTLQGGQTYTAALTEPTIVTATQPILCAIIDRSAGRGTGTRIGDPSMLVVPPTEQFLPSYTCISIEPNPNDPVKQPAFDEHYLTLIAPLDAEASLLVDGQPVPALRQIPTTSFGYTHVRVQQGTHRAECDKPFGIVAYGYGPAESYGYTGGMAFEPLNRAKPVIVVHDTAGRAGSKADIVVTYGGVADSLLFWAFEPLLLNMTLQWNATVFVGRDTGTLFIDTMRYRVRYAFDTLDIGDTLATIPGTIVLGNTAMDSVKIIDVFWQNVDGDTVPISASIRNGAIRVLDLCDEAGRTRLFDPIAQPASLVQVFDLRGRCVASVAPEGLSDALAALDRGLYVLVRHHGHHVVTERRLVE